MNLFLVFRTWLILRLISFVFIVSIRFSASASIVPSSIVSDFVVKIANNVIGNEGGTVNWATDQWRVLDAI